ncbi:MerR family transcriptional regulator [Methylosinus sp. Sm6]|uniref:MerR family transcriptional regulator n=1 Tax=Methylosinus sp. Sm6 TaxID=2866948 RepID=UPI001C99242F|nr:MerR family transcriptional regulator [Methylosinus sp. Sm6]
MRIGDVAQQLGVSTRTLRHYEAAGLIRPTRLTGHSLPGTIPSLIWPVFRGSFPTPHTVSAWRNSRTSFAGSRRSVPVPRS